MDKKNNTQHKHYVCLTMPEILCFGMPMCLLGQSPAGAQQAARLYERIIEGREDQVYDQTAIWNGASYLQGK